MWWRKGNAPNESAVAGSNPATFTMDHFEILSNSMKIQINDHFLFMTHSIYVSLNCKVIVK